MNNSIYLCQSIIKISYQNITGWVKSECTIFINPNSSEEQKQTTAESKTKEQLLSTLSINMQLNKPSGLTLEQFKKVLSDSKDKNKIFENNAEYFYYIEKQYNINGIFVAIGTASTNDLARKIGARVENNKIIVNDNLETTVPNLYACGDCTGGK